LVGQEGPQEVEVPQPEPMEEMPLSMSQVMEEVVEMEVLWVVEVEEALAEQEPWVEISREVEVMGAQEELEAAVVAVVESEIVVLRLFLESEDLQDLAEVQAGVDLTWALEEVVEVQVLEVRFLWREQQFSRLRRRQQPLFLRQTR
jgi:hypothetical protein